MSFSLDSRLVADSLYVGDLPLCQLRLMNDQRFYWLLLIPRVATITEVMDLTTQQFDQLWQEVRQLSELIKPWQQADKINIATLGNQVAQLHVHVIARCTNDAAWPAPVWGQGTAQPYTAAAGQDACAQLRAKCAELLIK